MIDRINENIGEWVQAIEGPFETADAAIDHLRQRLALCDCVGALAEALRDARSDLFYQLEAKHGPKAASEYPSVVKADAALAAAKEGK